MSDDTTTGIPNPDKPDHWLIPPWPAGASFSGVVRHFLRHHPWGNTNTAHLLAYFEGYRAALEAAPTDEPDLCVPSALARGHARLRHPVRAALSAGKAT